jgi:hypothetical protein
LKTSQLTSLLKNVNQTLGKVNDVLAVDTTKNSPEAYLPIVTAVGVQAEAFADTVGTKITEAAGSDRASRLETAKLDAETKLAQQKADHAHLASILATSEYAYICTVCAMAGISPPSPPRTSLKSDKN